MTTLERMRIPSRAVNAPVHAWDELVQEDRVHRLIYTDPSVFDTEMTHIFGGTWVYVAPGVRFNAASRWSASAAVALPVWQHIRASHPDNRYRLVLSVGRAF